MELPRTAATQAARPVATGRLVGKGMSRRLSASTPGQSDEAGDGRTQQALVASWRAQAGGPTLIARTPRLYARACEREAAWCERRVGAHVAKPGMPL